MLLSSLNIIQKKISLPVSSLLTNYHKPKMAAEYMTEEEIANYNPQDFNSQAQFKLSDFILLTSMYNRKIPHKEFAEFNELVYDRREELRDQDYMDIMERLSSLLPSVAAECSCAPGSNQFCYSGIDDFIYCQNYSKWSATMPQIEFIRFYREHPSYNNRQLSEFLKEYCAEPLQIRIGVNPLINTRETYMSDYISILKDLINLCEAQPICAVGRALLIIMNLKFCLENVPTYDDKDQQKRYYNTIFAKCDELSAQCVSPIAQQLRQILGWQDCPFKTIQRLMVENRHLPGFQGIPAETLI